MSFAQSVIGTLAVALAACSASPNDGATSQRAADTVTRTIVRIRPDGSTRTEASVITRAEQLQEIAQKERYAKAAAAGGFRVQDIVVDWGCSFTSMWIFSEPNTAGNEACFLQDGNEAGTAPGNGGAWTLDLWLSTWADSDQLLSGTIQSAWVYIHSGRELIAPLQ